MAPYLVLGSSARRHCFLLLLYHLVLDLFKIKAFITIINILKFNKNYIKLSCSFISCFLQLPARENLKKSKSSQIHDIFRIKFQALPVFYNGGEIFIYSCSSTHLIKILKEINNEAKHKYMNTPPPPKLAGISKNRKIHSNVQSCNTTCIYSSNSHPMKIGMQGQSNYNFSLFACYCGT